MLTLENSGNFANISHVRIIIYKMDQADGMSWYGDIKKKKTELKKIIKREKK